MDLTSILMKAGGVNAMAEQLGIPPQVAQAGAEALLPAVLGGFKSSAQSSSGGLGDLIGMIGGMGGGSLFDNVVGPEATNVSQGNDILGNIFGSKDVSRTVADQASSQTGIDPSILKKMLPMLAMLVAGYMAHQSGQEGQGSIAGNVLGSLVGGGQQSGGLGGILSSVLGGGQAAPQQQSGGLGGLGSLLDMDGDGNPLDDIIGMAGKAMGR